MHSVTVAGASVSNNCDSTEFNPMPVIAVINHKGGSGKSTLATHLAGYAASIGLGVMLGDVDKQKSTLVWLKRRAKSAVARTQPITSWVADPQKVLRPPKGITHVVLDTPGGLRDFDLARVVMSADAVLIPVCDSAFDRDASAQCWAALKAHPRVASGRCQIAAVGMRVDGRTNAEASLKQWAASVGLPMIGVIRHTQSYVRCIELGLTVFDLPPSRTQLDRVQWEPILAWLDPLWTHSTLATPSQSQALLDLGAHQAPAATRITPKRTTPAALEELAAALRPAPKQAARRWPGLWDRLRRLGRLARRPWLAAVSR
jgi:chromosome partitioning protein